MKWEGKIPYYCDGVITTMKLDEDNPPPYMDCSDFSSSVYYTVFDFKIGYNCATQIACGVEVDEASVRNGDYVDLRPADLIYFCWPNSEGVRDGSPDHVAIYIGDGEFIHEGGTNSTGGNVKIGRLDSNWGDPYGYVYTNVYWVRRIIQDDGEIVE